MYLIFQPTLPILFLRNLPKSIPHVTQNNTKLKKVILSGSLDQLPQQNIPQGHHPLQKWLPIAGKVTPTCPQGAQRGPQGDPKVSQRTPKSYEMHPKSTPKRNKKTTHFLSSDSCTSAMFWSLWSCDWRPSLHSWHFGKPNFLWK